MLASIKVMTYREMLRLWGCVTGKDTEYVEISLLDFGRLWPWLGQALGSMLKMWEDLEKNG